MSALHIIEISPAIYAGAVNTKATIDAPVIKTSKGYIMPSIKVGGVAFLFNKVADYITRGDIVFVSDREPTIKREMYPDYKMDRARKRLREGESDRAANIFNQKELAEIILQDCGFKVYYADGYEADDILYSICKKYKRDFTNIFIHAGDSDNYINICENVSILPTSSRDKIVTRENFETTVSSKEITPYNSKTFSKVLYGDTSDNVPALPKHVISYLNKVFWSNDHFETMGDKEAMRALIQKECPIALNQFDLIYPLDYQIVLENFKDYNKARIDAWGAAVDCNRYRNRKMIKPAIQPIIDQFFSEGRALE